MNEAWMSRGNRAIYGTDAEFYVGSLFRLMMNPNGTRRPDLVSFGESYNPKLSIEVKSGRNRKGVMVDYQLHYGITSAQDYKELFGQEPKERSNPQIDLFSKIPKNLESVAYYYNLISRTETEQTASKFMSDPFSSIKLIWDDQFIVPHDFAYYNFAVCKSVRTGSDIKFILEELEQIVKEDVSFLTGQNGNRNYNLRKSDNQSWQNLYGNDILSIFNRNPELLTRLGKERIELMKEYYPRFDSLQRVLIPGPNKTNIYILCHPEDYGLFNKQVKKIVQTRIPKIEKVLEERQENIKLLKKIRKELQVEEIQGEIPTLLAIIHDNEEDVEYDVTVRRVKTKKIITGVNQKKIKLLERLIQWLPENEKLLRGQIMLDNFSGDEKVPF
jgi:hypothetical protein